MKYNAQNSGERYQRNILISGRGTYFNMSKELSHDYGENYKSISERLRCKESFDILERKLRVGEDGEIRMWFIDGFVKDSIMQRVMQFLLELESLTPDAQEFIRANIPYVEVEVTSDEDKVILAVLSGQTAILGSTFGNTAVLVDTRSYPARPTGEPDSDRVMQGSHDGFVETLVFNTTLIRRRIRDPRLTMEYHNVGGASNTDIVVCYMKGIADDGYVREIGELIDRIKPRSLTLGFQSLAESMIRRKWYNPFPKIRTTERPDTAAAQLMEGSVIVLCDTAPQAMILPTSIFDFLQQTDDYYTPPLTGSYLRIVRMFSLIMSVILTPLWYLLLQYASVLPERLRFLIPDTTGAFSILFQLLLAEIAIDVLKLASMNTPNMLSNSLSIIGALILGDFAVSVGWLCEDVIFYMAVIAIANFAQHNNELGYALKFMRIITLLLTAAFGLFGFIGGIVFTLVAVATNRSINGKYSYLYPLIPWNSEAMGRLLLRRRKMDFDGSAERDHATGSETGSGTGSDAGSESGTDDGPGENSDN